MDERLERFKADLAVASATTVVGKYVLAGDCFALDDDKHFSLRDEVAQKFGVHTNEVVLVGSSRLGFSLAPQKRYREFGDRSDIDIAIVSPALFDAFWEELFLFEQSGGYWDRASDFKEYLFRGWMRPDMLPRNNYASGSDWWEFFQELTRSKRYGPYKVRAGLYRTWNFLTNYHEAAVADCQNYL